MGFSSQAISVKSSINLSDINIDSDLDMGSNKIIGYSKDNAFYIKWGVTPLDYHKFETPIKLVDNTTLVTNNTTSYATKISFTMNSSLNENITNVINRKYYIAWETNISSGQSGYSSFIKLDNKEYSAQGTNSNLYGSYGNTTDELITGRIYDEVVNIQLRVSTAGQLARSNNNQIYLTSWVDYHADILTPAIINSYGFTEISNILLNPTDQIKINDDIIYKGTAGNYNEPIYYCDTSYGKYNKFSDFKNITQIERIAGNPIIAFKI